jgi:hypothetical protein
MRSAGLFQWISENQPPDSHQFAHGWWSLAEFLQELSYDFEGFEFGVMSSFLMETPPPSSTILMPLVSARSSNFEIIFKESWILDPNYTVTVKWGFPEPLLIPPNILLSILEPIDPKNKWLLRDFPEEHLHEPYLKGATAFSGSVKNQPLLYAFFHVLSFEAKQAGAQMLKL